MKNRLSIGLLSSIFSLFLSSCVSTGWPVIGDPPSEDLATSFLYVDSFMNVISINGDAKKTYRGPVMLRCAPGEYHLELEYQRVVDKIEYTLRHSFPVIATVTDERPVALVPCFEDGAFTPLHTPNSPKKVMQYAFEKGRASRENVSFLSFRPAEDSAMAVLGDRRVVYSVKENIFIADGREKATEGAKASLKPFFKADAGKILAISIAGSDCLAVSAGSTVYRFDATTMILASNMQLGPTLSAVEIVEGTIYGVGEEGGLYAWNLDGTKKADWPVKGKAIGIAVRGHYATLRYEEDLKVVDLISGIVTGFQTVVSSSKSVVHAMVDPVSSALITLTDGNGFICYDLTTKAKIPGDMVPMPGLIEEAKAFDINDDGTVLYVISDIQTRAGMYPRVLKFDLSGAGRGIYRSGPFGSTQSWEVKVIDPRKIILSDDGKLLATFGSFGPRGHPLYKTIHGYAFNTEIAVEEDQD